MSETGACKRPRKVVNYATMDSLDISDDDEFSGFSSPASKPLHRKPHKDSSMNEKSKLAKKKLSKQRPIAESELPLTSEVEDSDGASTRSAPRPRPALHEKLFQRDLEAALELSRQSAGVAAPEENKEIFPSCSFSPPRPLQLPSATGITSVTVPVDVHGPKTSPAHTSIVCRKGNTDVRIQPLAAPQEGGTIDHIVLEHSLPDNDATEDEGDGLNRSAEHNYLNSALLANGSEKCGKRKACVIESDDDDFNTATHHNGVTSTLVGETRIIIRSGPERVSPTLLSKPCASENEDTASSPKVREVSRGVEESSSNSSMKGRQLATPRSEADLPTSGRGKRARRAVSFVPEPDSESEDEWAEPDELDEDDLSVSEGSDFEPSPKKDHKKSASSNKKKAASVKTGKEYKSDHDTIKSSSATLANSNRSSVSSAVATSKAAVKLPLNRTPSSVTPISNVSVAAKSHSLSKFSSTPCATSFASQLKSESLVCHGDRSTTSSPVTAFVLSKNGTTSVPLKAGLARAAFKCPVMNGSTNGGSPAARGQATSIPTGTLRLGLSRRASFKPLHPNATVK